MYQTAWLIGLASSLHCVGMCGPLTLALHLPLGERLRSIWVLLTYHAGRLLMYALLGLVVGFLGKGMAWAGFQKGFSMIFGVAMLLSAGWMLLGKPMPSVFSGVRFFNFDLHRKLGQALRQRGMLVAGMLNGLLPCGMVYVALAGAVASTNNWQSSIYMLFFGVGTLPALLGLGMASRFFQKENRKYLRWVQPLLLAMAGWLLLQRGLHLDLSMWDSAVPKAGYDCH